MLSSPMSAYGINDDYSLSVMKIGNEKNIVVIIDNLLSSADTLIDYAVASAAFKPVSTGQNFYPGVRAPAPKEYALGLSKALRPLAQKHMAVDTSRLESARCALSIACMPPSQMSLIQKIPHYDTSYQQQVAAVHYLCDATHGGTAFFRHRQTGYESISPERSAKFQQVLQTELAQTSDEPIGYGSYGDTMYEKRAHIEAKPNRLILYKSNLFHSGMVNPDLLSHSPSKGRLTSTLFMRFA